ncbi:hypothetical protein [Natronobacterium texcoconense]|nr:hypothetical protein [Natronobacterium texcoconense]
MDDQTLQRLKEGYPTASWALWSPTFPEDGCIEEDPEELFEFVRNRKEQVRPSIVLLSLNPSTHMPASFENFHSTDPTHRNDQFRDIVVDSGLEGAYMTDLVERVGADSQEIEPTPDDVQHFLEQLELLDQDHYHVICFLEPVYQELKAHFNGKTRSLQHEILTFSADWNGTPFHCYRVWFHANWGTNREKIAELRKQLSYLHSKITGSETTTLSDWE